MMTLVLTILCTILAVDVPRPDLSDAETPVRERLTKAASTIEANPNDGDAWGRYGILLQAHSCDAEAAVAYTQAHALDPDEFRWPYFHAVVALKDDPVTGLALLDAAMAIRSDYGPAHERKAVALESLGKMHEAEAPLRDALRLFRRSPSANLLLAQRELRNDEPARALAALEVAYESWPRSTEVLSTMARAHMRLGQPEKARQFSDAARDGRTMPPVTDPMLNEVSQAGVRLASFLNRADAALQDGRMETALTELQEALRIGHDPGRVNEAIARVRLNRGELDQCIAACQAALDAGYDSTTIHHLLGTAQLQKRALVAADQSVRRGLMMDADDPALQRLSGQLAAARGQHEDAVRIWSAALEKQDDATTRRLRAQSLSVLGRHDDAIAELEAMTASRLALPVEWFAYADALRRAERHDAAIAAFRKIDEPVFAVVVGRGIAASQIALGKYTDAQTQLETLHRARPRNANVTNDLAWLLATCPSDVVRDGTRALQLIQPLVRQSNRRAPAILDTYAACLAENGRFKEAVTVMTEAIRLLNPQARQAQGASYEQRLEVYRAGRAWRSD